VLLEFVKMDEEGFPYAKFELVQQVDNQHLKEIETQRLEPVGKGILDDGKFKL
jgi:hypothetical protein